LCEPLGRPVLFSAEFATAVEDTDSRLEPLGHYSLRGVRDPKEIFALASSEAAWNDWKLASGQASRLCRKTLRSEFIFELSVYTSKDGKFFEVLVDYATGRITESEPITEGDDLADAKSQSAAMAKTALKVAVEKVLGQSPGFRAISVTPDLKDGRPVASVVLLNGKEFKTLQASLEWGGVWAVAARPFLRSRSRRKPSALNVLFTGGRW
jgi:hypothetical protein